MQCLLQLLFALTKHQRASLLLLQLVTAGAV
jgi:hypothetical protein